MSDVTRILGKIEAGDVKAAEELLPLVYNELRKLAAVRMANERPDHTLQATALVHDAYLRLVNVKEARQWESRGHFFSAAAESMRRILLDRARDKKRLKRGGNRQRIDLDRIEIALDTDEDQLVALDDAITVLAGQDPMCAELVKLRFFAGLTHADAAESLGITRRVADRHWAYARAWLFERLRED